MTATAEQIDVLKQSLSNFKEGTKKIEAEDEYIEEIFEDAGAEDDDSDHVNSGNNSIVELSEQDRLKMVREEE